MPLLNAKQVQADLARMGWSEARLAEEMGWSHPHYSEVKHRRRRVNGLFMDCLLEAFRATSYDRFFAHPSLMNQPVNARTRLAIVEDEFGRPWPTGGGPAVRSYDAPYQRHLRRKQLEADVAHYGPGAA